MPLYVYRALETADPNSAIALSLLLVAVCVTVLVALRGALGGSRVSDLRADITVVRSGGFRLDLSSRRDAG